jgi:type I restriction enzyme S subunit
MILPPLPIQQEIVTALDLIYNNAATAKATVASVKSQMASVMRSVCARGFERKHIKDVMNVVSGKANQDREAGRPVPYYDSNGVIGYVVEPLYTGEYTITARNLSIGAVHYINGPFYPSDHTINFTSLNQNVMNNRFFYYWLHLNNQVLKELSSGIKPGIRKSDVAEILMPVPPIQFQHEILAILNEMEAELATLEQMAAKAEQRAKFILDGYTC